MTDDTDTVDVYLPALDRTVPVDPYDLDDPDDFQAMLDVWTDVAVDRVAIDDFDHAVAQQMTVTDLAAIMDVALPTDQGDADG